MIGQMSSQTTHTPVRKFYNASFPIETNENCRWTRKTSVIRIASDIFLRMRVSHPVLIYFVSGQLLHAGDSVTRLICTHMAVPR